MFIRGLTFLGSSHSVLELELKYCIFSMEIESVIVVCIWPNELPEIRIPIISQKKGVKVEV